VIFLFLPPLPFLASFLFCSLLFCLSSAANRPAPVAITRFARTVLIALSSQSKLILLLQFLCESLVLFYTHVLELCYDQPKASVSVVVNICIRM